MSYVLGTLHSTVKWYKFGPLSGLPAGTFELLLELDLNQVPMFGDKKSAKEAARALELKTYRYVKL